MYTTLLLLLPHLAHATDATWEDQVALTIGGPETAPERVAALRAAVVDAGGDPRLRALVSALPALEGQPHDARVELVARALRGETIEVAAPREEAWSATLLARLLDAGDGREARAVVAETRRSVPEADPDRLDALDGILDLLPAGRDVRRLDGLFASALSTSRSERARADLIGDGSLESDLTLVGLGLLNDGRARERYRVRVVDGWWYTCAPAEGSTDWIWTEEKPERDACPGWVENRRRGPTVMIEEEPMQTLAEVRQVVPLRKPDGCDSVRVHVSDRRQRWSATPTVTLDPVVLGLTALYVAVEAAESRPGARAPARPIDCRTRKELYADVEAVNTELDAMFVAAARDAWDLEYGLTPLPPVAPAPVSRAEVDGR